MCAHGAGDGLFECEDELDDLDDEEDGDGPGDGGEVGDVGDRFGDGVWEEVESVEFDDGDGCEEDGDECVGAEFSAVGRGPAVAECVEESVGVGEDGLEEGHGEGFGGFCELDVLGLAGRG